MSLAALGYDARFSFLFDEAAARAPSPVVPGRVVRVDRGRALVHDGSEVRSLPFTGSFVEDPPAVGDFVGFDPGSGRIVFVVDRRQTLARRAAGSSGGVQVVAANVDVVLATTPADRLNPAWVERALALAWESGATPRVVLTKADLLEDAAAVVDDLAARALGADVLAVSSPGGQGVEELQRSLAGQTAVLLGPSGAGKSTLLNALLGGEVAAVGAVREGDRKGRHTTVRRELHVLPGGGLLIDTPGTRELGLLGTGGGAASPFADIDALGEGCRFRDCQHLEEPGCAVRAAVAEGRLDEDRYQSFLRQQRELRWLAEKAVGNDAAQRARGRVLARMVRDVVANKRRR